jgi:stress-induced morphogen
MCIATTCNTCGKQTWKGCGLHIEAALSNVTLEARCKGWETGKCPGVEESKEDGPLSCKNIESKLREGFEGIEFLSVEDLSDGCGDKFKIVIVSDVFEGVKLVDRHRMVNGSHGVLKNIMDAVHAMELKTWTVAQYTKKMKK